jgi:thiamine biosynthesis lipoprotein
MSRLVRHVRPLALGVVCLLAAAAAPAADLPTLAGPAMGTTYRVTLARDLPDVNRGEVHREIERVLARIDRTASTWRDDSDVSRFNRANAHEWVAVGDDLVAIVAIARAVHARTAGRFDITAAAPGSGRPMGLVHVTARATPPALLKTTAGIRLDLGGIGPGYAVDRIGARLEELGSAAHLVELGGEVRAWGTRPDGGQWLVRLRSDGGSRPAAADVVVELAPGEAIATATAKPGRSPVDPRTGRLVTPGRPQATVRAWTCAEADALAVAALVDGDTATGGEPHAAP